jgi:subtilisin family serine protease
MDKNLLAPHPASRGADRPRCGPVATRLALAMALVVAAWSGAAQAQKPLRRPMLLQQNEPAQWASGELLVGLRAGTGPSQRAGLLRDHGASFLDDIGQTTRIVHIRVPAAQMDAVARRLESRPMVKFVEKNYVFTPSLLPNDPQYASQWHLPLIQAPQAWDLTQGTAGSVIAILDSGIDATHPEFAGKLVAGYNTYANTSDTTDVYGHGTQVAGAAAARTNNAVGVAGVAGSSPIMPVRVTDNLGRATSASIANGIIWAANHGARVVNLSFGNVAGNATISAAAEYAYNHGTLVVAASGNCGCPDPTLENPFILSVSATDETDAVASFSSTGPFVDLSAPGNNILTTAKGGLYLTESGTSLASPVVAGAAGLMFAANPALTPAAAMQLLEATSVSHTGGTYVDTYGYGRVDVAAAVAAAANYAPPADTTPPVVALSAPTQGATVSGTAVVTATATDNVGVVKVDLYVDGANFATDASSPYSFAWDTAGLANGPHQLAVTATDAAGNTAGTTPITVTLSNTPPDTTLPVVSITAPAAGATVSGTVTVTASATDNVGVKRVDFYVDGILLASDTTAPYAATWSTSGVAGGSHTLQASAADAAGNVATATSSVTVPSANQPPVAVNDTFTAPVRTASSYSARVLTVLANDRDADGSLNAASVRIVAVPNKGGTVSVISNGTLSYTPKNGFKGSETIGYTVKDTQGATSNTATVTVTVK